MTFNYFAYINIILCASEQYARIIFFSTSPILWLVYNLKKLFLVPRTKRVVSLTCSQNRRIMPHTQTSPCVWARVFPRALWLLPFLLVEREIMPSHHIISSVIIILPVEGICPHKLPFWRPFWGCFLDIILTIWVLYSFHFKGWEIIVTAFLC